VGLEGEQYVREKQKVAGGMEQEAGPTEQEKAKGLYGQQVFPPITGKQGEVLDDEYDVAVAILLRRKISTIFSGGRKMRKLSITVITLAIVLMSGCGGHEPNPVALHQVGDDTRTCESLRLEIAQNEVFITKKLKKDESKFWTNTAWFLFFTPAMDLKDAEKTEAETLQHRNECLKILMAEKGCGATTATDPNETIQKSKKFIGYRTESSPGGETKFIPVYKSNEP